MSTERHSGLCPREVTESNRALAALLLAWHMTLLHWKSIKAIVHLAAISLAVYAISQGAEPILALAAAAVIIQGPEILEWLAVREDFIEYEERVDEDE